MLAQSNTGPAAFVGSIAFWNLQGAPWGKRFAVVYFGQDGNLYTAPIHLGPVYVNMGPYEANRWYHVNVVIDRTAGKYSVWIDDTLEAVDIAIPDTYEINALMLESGHAEVKVYYDDVRVFEPESLPPTPLSVSIAPLSASTYVGDSVAFTSTVNGGTPPYSYQWYLNNNPMSGATSNSWTFMPTTSGVYYVYLKVTDTLGNTTQSETARITVTSVPVGGYSVSLTGHGAGMPSSVYLALFIMLSAVFTTIRRKTRREKKLVC
jgi:PKD repeat protein